MSSIQIRRATTDDVDAIDDILSESPQASHWPTTDYLVYECRVAVVDGRVAGFLASRMIAEREYEILNVAVAAADRRRGIGRALLGAELNQPGGVWYLEVRESNLPAISLYIAMGFVVAGRRADYYDQPMEAAIVMRFFS